MDYQQSCTTTDACHHSVYATHHGYTQTPSGWSVVPQYQYAYEQHTLAPMVGAPFSQGAVVAASAAPAMVDGQNGFVPIPLEQSPMYRHGVEADYGQPLSPPVEFNMDELLEYQRRRSSATSEEKESLTPAQRRRKAQNRAAQRAFRDRKRQRVQDLEAQLSALETRTNSLESDNKRLKHELLLTQDENEVLRSINQAQSPRNALQSDQHTRGTRTKVNKLHLPNP